MTRVTGMIGMTWVIRLTGMTSMTLMTRVNVLTGITGVTRMTGMSGITGMTWMIDDWDDKGVWNDQDIFLTEMTRLRMHPNLSGGRGRGQKGLENCA